MQIGSRFKLPAVQTGAEHAVAPEFSCTTSYTDPTRRAAFAAGAFFVLS